MKKIKIGIFGATGGVGKELLKLLDDIRFPVGAMSLYAGRSAGTVMDTPSGIIEVKKTEDADYSGLDLAFWSINADWSRKNREKAMESHCYVIDNSQAFRQEPDIPLIVPEINGHILRDHPSRLIANPNCTTAIAALPLHKLDEMAGIEYITVSTWQSASGAGDGGREELLQETRNYLDGRPMGNRKFQHPLPFNVIPHIDKFMDNGYTREEMKIKWETRKILGLDDRVGISSTCVRVPVLRSHALDIAVETMDPVDYDEYRTLLSREPMIKLRDDPQNLEYPMPSNTTGVYPVAVGRIRALDGNRKGVRMFVCGDQLLRGAALNAVLIARKLHEYGRL